MSRRNLMFFDEQDAAILEHQVFEETKKWRKE
jgi:hypothetical protein